MSEPTLPPILAFSAPSGTGKSTAIVRLLGELRRRGLAVGVLKHDAHRLSYDKPGKDTWKFRQAGAERAVIAGEHEVAVFTAPPPDPSVQGLVARWLSDVDLVLVEGYRNADLPCVRLHRQGAPSTEGWRAPRKVVAWFTDEDLDSGVPELPLDDATAQAGWVLAFLGLSGGPAATP